MKRTLWFAHHEFRLAWRDFIALVTAGRPGRARIVFGVIAVFVVLLHLVAWMLVGPYAAVTFPLDRDTLIVVTGCAFLAWTGVISQAMESVTRAFYSRADLDLLLSSPGPVRPIFALRIASVGLLTTIVALILIAPFINALAYAGGAHWLAAYGVLLAASAAATALAVGLTVFLFRTIGPKRTRFVAQVAAAIVGAAFVIGIQAISILVYGSVSRFDALRADWLLTLLPGTDSAFWLPARAAMGDLAALASVLTASLLLFALAVTVASRRFGEFTVAAASVGQGTARQRAQAVFRSGSAAAALRRKEWKLLRRDPWLASQTLMQILYLIPPALLLWRNFATESGGLLILVPVLVMASGQLAGGLAWLAISGEDAPDLVSTAPLRANAVLRAKVEAVVGAVAIVVAPIVFALAFASPWMAAIAAGGVLAASASATAIQMAFRAQAKRSQFRRRHTSSRIATFAEALTSVAWAATAGLAAAGNPLGMATAVIAVAIVGLASLMRPSRRSAMAFQ